jgi:hypothetical protein
MGDTFDKMAKALASTISRRDAFKYVSAGALATMLAGVGVREAEAAKCTGSQACGTCPPTDCTPNGNGGQCFCLRKFKQGVCQSDLKAKCIQNASCSGLISCTKGKECRTQLGANWKCTDGACCGVVGVCTALCGTVPPCCTSQQSGGTLAG